MQYVMIPFAFDTRVKPEALYNNSIQPEAKMDFFPAKVVGFCIDPGKKIEVIVEAIIDTSQTQTGRFYDVPLSFLGNDREAGMSYDNLAPDTKEVPFYTAETWVRMVNVYREGRVIEGNRVGSLTWNYADVTLNVVVTSTGTVILAPPHKITVGYHPSFLPSWMRKRYDDSRFPLELTRVYDPPRKKAEEARKLAVRALESDEGWRSHGLGLVQKYVDGLRVHVWSKGDVKIGLNGGIHNHRYSLNSIVVLGVITQEEWEATENPQGMWSEFWHDNATWEVEFTGKRYDLTPRTQDIYAGQMYSFPRHCFHRTLPRSEIAITVVDREGVEGKSCALAPVGVNIVNGQSIELDVKKIVSSARKHLGVK